MVAFKNWPIILNAFLKNQCLVKLKNLEVIMMIYFGLVANCMTPENKQANKVTFPATFLNI